MPSSKTRSNLGCRQGKYDEDKAKGTMLNPLLRPQKYLSYLFENMSHFLWKRWLREEKRRKIDREAEINHQEQGQKPNQKTGISLA